MSLFFGVNKKQIAAVCLCFYYMVFNQLFQLVQSETCNIVVEDELWPLEWYLNKSEGDKYDMNVLPAWRSCINGTGITVGVVDKGVQDHADLKINRRVSFGFQNRRFSFWDVNDGAIRSLKHGTRIAGLIGAMKNKKFTIGIAFGAEIADLKIASSSVFNTFDESVLTHNGDIIDVYSSSFANFHTGVHTYALEENQRAAFLEGTTKGRRGLGSVYVFATGNSGGDVTELGHDSCAYDRLVTNRFVISVAGIQNDLSKVPNGEACSAMLVAAFTARGGATHHRIVTTDVGNKYTYFFNQNSAAVPMVSGAVALALSANPNLSYRDVMHLLVLTSRGDLPEFERGEFMKNGANLSVLFCPLLGHLPVLKTGICSTSEIEPIVIELKPAPEDDQEADKIKLDKSVSVYFDFETKAFVSSLFGFGLLDIGALVTRSRNWPSVPKRESCKATISCHQAVSSSSHVIHIHSCNIGYAEHVEVTLKVNHPNAGQIQWVLVSPYQTRSKILPGRFLDPTKYMNLTVLTVQMWGENPNGYWKLEPTALFNRKLSGGTMELITLTIHGFNCASSDLKCVNRAKQELKCEPNSVYTTHKNLCEPTCSNPFNKDETVCLKCKALVGCECNKGYYRRGKNCVPLAKCGCVLESDKYIPLGGKIVTDCEVLKCMKSDGKAKMKSIRKKKRCGPEQQCKMGSKRGKQCPSLVPITLPVTTDSTCGLVKVDLVIILDSFSSVGYVNYQKMKNFCKDFLKNADLDSGNVKVGIVSYNTKVDVEFYLNDYKTSKDIMTAIDKIKYRDGFTNTADSLKTMRTKLFTTANGAREDVPDVCIILTDGVSNLNRKRTIPEAEQARAKGIHIYAVGIGLRDTRELEGIASVPASENSFNVRSFDELPALSDTVFESFCPVPITLPVTPASPCGLVKVDLVIILDSSTSVGYVNYQKMKKFCKDFLKNADLDSGNVKVGIVSYNTNAHVELFLNDYDTYEDIMTAIDKIKYRPTYYTNTADSLKTMRTKLFMTANGAREDVPDVCIILTAGRSNFNWKRTIPEAEQARAEGIHIYAVGIGLRYTHELEGIASVPASENIFHVQSFDELTALTYTVFKSFCRVSVTTAILPTTLPVTAASPCGLVKVDLVIILDSSTSVGYVNYQKMKKFCKDFLKNADLDSGNVKVGIVSYNTNAHVELFLNDYETYEDIMTAIDKIKYRPTYYTNTADSLKTMRTKLFMTANGAREDVPDVCIILTAGRSNFNWKRTIPEAEQARAEGIHIYAVGIGLRYTHELEGIASVPASENSFHVQSFDELTALKYTVFKSFCRVPITLSVTTAILPTTLPVTAASLPTTLPVTAASPCGLVKVDLVIILDSSTSVGYVNYQKMKKFCKDFLKNADLDSGNVKVGIVSYNTNAHVELFLNDYETYEDIMTAIDKIKYRPTYYTNTAGSLKTMRTKLFMTANGAREDVPDVCIILTAGRSNFNWKRTIPEAEQARAEGIHIYAVGIGLRYTHELEGIASVPASENSFHVQSFDELTALKYTVFKSLCRVPTTLPVTAASLPTTLHVTPDSPCGLVKVDLVIILDSSSSVGYGKYQKMKDFFKDFLKNADLDSGNVKVGIVSYSTKVHVEFYLNDYKTSEDIMAAIDKIKYLPTYNTNTADSLKTMRTKLFMTANGAREDVPDVCIILTAGRSNLNWKRTIPEAEQARAEGIHIYAVGIGLRYTRELEGIASVPASENSFKVQGFDELAALRDTVFESFCQVPTTLPVTAATPCGLAKVDLVIILDSSTSVGYGNYQKMKNFCKDFLKNADLIYGNLKVGIVSYSTKVHVEFYLNDYKTSKDIMTAIDKIEYRHGNTNTADSLKTMRTKLFTTAYGAREDVPDVCIIVTEGLSNLNWERTIPEAEQARAEGIQIYAVGIGLRDTRELEGIASVPATENMFNVQSFGELAALSDTVFDSLCRGQI